jgi:hypothetical protein
MQPTDTWLADFRIGHLVCSLEQLILWAQALDLADRKTFFEMVAAIWDAAAENGEDNK